MTKFKIGDVLQRKGTRDGLLRRVSSIIYKHNEREYELTPTRGNGNTITLGEEAVSELYTKF